MMRLRSLFPVVVTGRHTEARNFYIRHFGFRVVFEVDWYLHLHAARDGDAAPVELAFTAPRVDSQPELLHTAFSGAGVIVTIDVEDVDDVHRRLSDAGVLEDVVIGLRDEAWGQRHFLFRDPVGTLLDVVQLIPPSAEYAAASAANESPRS